MDGNSHATASMIAAIPVALLVAQQSGVEAGIGALVGCGVIGLILGPDLDIDDVTDSEWLLIRRLGPFGVIGWLWVAYFWPYAWKIPHRSFWSHAPLISTAIRVAYLLWWLPILVYAKSWTIPPEWIPILIGAFKGLCISDTLHWLMDAVPGKRRSKARNV